MDFYKLNRRFINQAEKPSTSHPFLPLFLFLPFMNNTTVQYIRPKNTHSLPLSQAINLTNISSWKALYRLPLPFPSNKYWVKKYSTICFPQAINQKDIFGWKALYQLPLPPLPSNLKILHQLHPWIIKKPPISCILSNQSN